MLSHSQISFQAFLEDEESEHVQEYSPKENQRKNTQRYHEKIDADEEEYIVVYKGKEQDVSNRFYQKLVVFTMLSIPREKEYTRIVEQIGGYVKGHLVKKTDYLIVADDSFPYLHDEEKSTTKMRQAIKWQAQGVPMQIISETEFLNSISTDIVWQGN